MKLRVWVTFVFSFSFQREGFELEVQNLKFEFLFQWIKEDIRMCLSIQYLPLLWVLWWCCRWIFSHLRLGFWRSTKGKQLRMRCFHGRRSRIPAGRQTSERQDEINPVGTSPSRCLCEQNYTEGKILPLGIWWVSIRIFFIIWFFWRN